jgi:hypothetical protein
VVLVREIIPVALGAGDYAAEFIKFFVARDAFQLLFGEERVFFVFLVLRYNKYNFFDLGLQKEQRLLDLQFVALEVERVVDLTDPVFQLVPVLVVLSLNHLPLNFGLQLLQIGEDFRLQAL